MEPSQTTVQVVRQPHPVKQVTTFSKFLALALIVVLPFLGGYVGYNLGVKTAKKNITEDINTVFVPETDTTTENADSPIPPKSAPTTRVPVSLNLFADSVSAVGGECKGEPPYDYQLVAAPDYYESYDYTVVETPVSKGWCWQGKAMMVDPATFKVIHRDPKSEQPLSVFSVQNISEHTDTVGIDKNGIYVMGDHLAATSRDFYQFYGEGQYFRLGTNVYAFEHMEIFDSAFASDYVLLPEVDSPTFTYTGGGYSKDKNSVYFGAKIVSSKPATFSAKTLPYEAGNDGWEAGTIDFGVDNSTVYFDGIALNGIDSATMYLGPGHRYVADNDTIYFFNFACSGPSTPTLGDLKEKDTYDNINC